METNETSYEKKCKGTPNTAKDQLTFKSYKNAVLKNQGQYVNFAKIAATEHELETVQVRKRVLTGFDDKRYILSCGEFKMNKIYLY